MTVVLDAAAAVALAIPNRDPNSVVRRAFDSNVCYMTDAAAIEMYCGVFDMVGSDAARYWLEFVTSGRDIRIAESDHTADFLESAGRASLTAGRQIPIGTSAALARKMRVPLVTSVDDAKDLADTGFCEIILF